MKAAVCALRPSIAALLTDDALCCDLACLISDTGANRQRLHTDTKCVPGHSFALRIAIQTLNLPGCRFKDPRGSLLTSTPPSHPP